MGENGLVSPLTEADYLIVGVIEEVTFQDSALEACVREDMGDRCPRTMAVLNPLKVTFENWPAICGPSPS